MIESQLRKVKDCFNQAKPVIVFDSENRENEADFIIPVEALTVETVNFMITLGKGLLCCAITEDRQLELNLDLMVNQNQSPFYTNFTTSVDLNHKLVTTGITAKERFLTLQALANTEKTEKDFHKPGHIFPLVAKKGLLRTRQGHTEASLELALITGYKPCSSLIEILDNEGNRADLNYCQKLAKKEGLEILNIQDLCKDVKSRG